MITPLTWSFHLFSFVNTSSRYSQVIKNTLLEGASVKKQHIVQREGESIWLAHYSMCGQGKIQLADNLSWRELYMFWQEVLCSSLEVASCWGSNGKSDLTEEVSPEMLWTKEMKYHVWSFKLFGSRLMTLKRCFCQKQNKTNNNKTWDPMTS